jgi:hypothetical protein
MPETKRIERFLEVLRIGYQDRGLVNGWEPPDINSPPIEWAVKEGYLRITNARCMFEIIPNAFVVWTDAGKRVMETLKKPLD